MDLSDIKKINPIAMRKRKKKIDTVHLLPGRNLLLLKENSLLRPSGGHSSQHAQPQAAEIEKLQ